MGFTSVTADTNGVIYVVKESGSLQFYRDEARNGTASWAHSGVGRTIGNSWQKFVQIFSGGDGIVYAVAENGELYFYRDLAQNGTPRWANGGVGRIIGSSWESFEHVFSGGDGVIYAITSGGDLRFYRDEARNGTARWFHGGVGQVIGHGWNDFIHVCSGGDGVIYAVTHNGDLLYFRDHAQDGTASWEFGGKGQRIGKGWHNFADLMSGGDGILYAITQDGFLMFFRDLARNGTTSWQHSGVPQQIGSGWNVVPRAVDALEGYSVPLSVSPGRWVEFKVSAAADYQLTILRLSKQADGSVGVPMTTPLAMPAGMQTRPLASWLHGCGWATTHRLRVPASWSSGLFSAQCADQRGHVFHIVFVVKATFGRRSDFAALANTNTWNAYNPRGGRSKYTKPRASAVGFERPNPETTPEGTAPTHLTRSELLVLKWLEDEGYRTDVYSDADLHRGIKRFRQYKALIVTTHPEYWTLDMVDHLQAYLEAGGCLVYLAGNGLFEKVEFSEGGDALVFTGGQPNVRRNRFYMRNLDPPRPERAILGVAYRDDAYRLFGPFRVVSSKHRFFAGTGLADGDLVGQTGVNGGGASGWEMDTSIPGEAPAGVIVDAKGADDRGDPPANLQLLARGVNDGKVGGDMTCYDTLGGGFVFAAGSISFGGSLVQDPKLQIIVRNVLDECLAR